MKLIEDSLCTGCGICAGICPEGDIEIRRNPNGLYSPKLKHNECRKCNLCKRVCPGESINVADLSRSIFGEENGDNPLLGHFIQCNYGHSTRETPRQEWTHESSSGGLASELAIYALEKKLVDGVVVTTMDREVPLEPRVFVARTMEEVVLASGSKYCPVPLGVSIKEILKQKGRFAIIGLPCHIHGIRKAEACSKELASKIVMHIGLFCGHSVNFLGTEYYLERFAIEKGDISRLDYRKGGWPGRIYVVTRNGRATYLSWEAFERLYTPYFFAPLRCTLCPDFTNELADISLGDAWLPELRRKQRKESFIIIRSQEGKRLLQKAIEDKRVWIAKVDQSRIIECFKGNLLFKKRGIFARKRIARILGSKTPEFGAFLLEPNAMSYVLGILVYFSILISSKKTLRKLLRYTPFPILGLYHSIFVTIKHWGQ
jgi:coenzyme F420 hydrogenase subunit beta